MEFGFNRQQQHAVNSLKVRADNRTELHSVQFGDVNTSLLSTMDVRVS